MEGKEKGTVTEEVTHDALSAAYDAIGKDEQEVVDPVVEEPVAEGEEPEVLETPDMLEGDDEGEGDVPRGTDALEEHKEKSKFGRKVKNLEERLAEQKATLDEAIGLIKKIATGPLTPPPPVPAVNTNDEAELEEIRELFFTDPIEASERLNEYKARKTNATITVYKSQYVSELEQLAKSEGDIYNEVIDMMVAHQDKYDITHSAGKAPNLDARINFMAAKAAVMAKHLEAGSKPVYRGKGDTTKPPVQPAGKVSSEAQRPKAAPKLDAPADALAKYLSRTGRMTGDEIAEAVG